MQCNCHVHFSRIFCFPLNFPGSDCVPGSGSGTEIAGGLCRLCRQSPSPSQDKATKKLWDSLSPKLSNSCVLRSQKLFYEPFNNGFILIRRTISYRSFSYFGALKSLDTIQNNECQQFSKRMPDKVRRYLDSGRKVWLQLKVSLLEAASGVRGSEQRRRRTGRQERAAARTHTTISSMCPFSIWFENYSIVSRSLDYNL